MSPCHPVHKAPCQAGGNVKTRIVVPLCALGLALCAGAEAPMIPPTIARIAPAGMERGQTGTFTIDGRSLSDASEVIFDTPGLSGKVIGITDIAEKITGPRAGEDLAAQVPLGKKQTARIEISAAKDAIPGVHRFRVKTPWGTSNLATFAVGTLPEIQRQEQMAPDSAALPQIIQLPATLVGTISTTGERHSYQFEGKAGQEIVFLVQASALGSRLAS